MSGGCGRGACSGAAGPIRADPPDSPAGVAAGGGTRYSFHLMNGRNITWWTPEQIPEPSGRTVLVTRAWPQLRSATDPGAEGASVWDPRRADMAGHPIRVRPPAVAVSGGHGPRLWQVSQELTGVEFPA